MNKIFAIALTLSVVLGCAHVKDVVRTVKDVGVDLCRTYFGENPDDAKALAASYGVTVQDLCAVAEVVSPFVDAALSAQRAGAQSLGLGEE